MLLKKLMVVKVYGIMWSDDISAAGAAYDTLIELNSSNCFGGVMSCRSLAGKKSFVAESCNQSEIITNHLFASKSPLMSIRPDEPDLQSCDIRNAALWKTEGKSFGSWVHPLVSALLNGMLGKIVIRTVDACPRLRGSMRWLIPRACVGYHEICQNTSQAHTIT